MMIIFGLIYFELKKIEQNMFEDLNNTEDINLKIEEIAKRNGVNLIQRK